MEASLSTFMDVLTRTLNDNYLARGIRVPMQILGAKGPLALDQICQGAILRSLDGYYLIEADAKHQSTTTATIAIQ